MPIQPWVVGQTAPDWLITLSVASNPASPDLTGLDTTAFTLVVVDAQTNAVSNGLGSFIAIVTNTNPAVVQYRPNASDLFVLNAKNYRIYVEVNYGTGNDFFGPYLFTTNPL